VNTYTIHTDVYREDTYNIRTTYIHNTGTIHNVYTQYVYVMLIMSRHVQKTKNNSKKVAT